MDSEELNELTGKVEAVRMKEGKGKQGKSEVWITMAETGQFRVAYGNTKTIKEVSNLIKKDDAITIYLKKAQNAFIDLGNDNDVLQLVKNGVIIYSLDIPQKNFQKYFMFSAIMSILLPLGCVFYWVKSRSNMMAALQNPTV
jgi:ATP-dependent Zn protease